MLTGRRWKLLFQLNKCGGDANRSSFTMANKYLFTNLLLFMSGRVRRGNVALFYS